MKKEDGASTLITLVTVAVLIIIGGVIVAMMYEKPIKSEEDVQSSINIQENNEVTDETNNIN